MNAPDGRDLDLMVIGRSAKNPESPFLTAAAGALEPATGGPAKAGGTALLSGCDCGFVRPGPDDDGRTCALFGGAMGGGMLLVLGGGRLVGTVGLIGAATLLRGCTISIGRSYGDEYPCLALSTKLLDA